ncbi:MAG: Leucine-rich repeat (LRR) protein [Salibacteraceae bacterium]|jgi:Leucine-rich repeat (LRR) protein
MNTFKSIISSTIVFALTANLAFGQNNPEIKVYHSIEEGLKEPEKVEYLEIESISDEDSLRFLSQFPKLQSLSLIDLHSASAPEAIADLTGLRELRFINDDFSTIPASYAKLTNLKRLEFIYDTHLNLQEALKVINKIPSLIELRIEGLPGSNFSNELTFPSQLHLLSLRNNHLNHIPNGILVLSELETLDLGDNEFFDLPYQLSNLTNLNTIYLDRLPLIQIDRIFPILNNVPKLQIVHLEGNHLNKEKIDGFRELSLFQIFLDENLIMNQQKVYLDLPEISRYSNDPKDASIKIPINRD